MSRTINNPYKVNHRFYVKLICFSTIFAAIFTCSAWIEPILRNILQNLSMGCFASALVAWLIEISNVREKNQRAAAQYNAVYGELKFKIELYIKEWARVCMISFKDSPEIQGN